MNCLDLQEAKSMKILIMFPTYNELENVKKLVPALFAQGLDADVLAVDDNSPDGTGQALEFLKQHHPRLQVMHRDAKQGIGVAHQAGIKWAYDHNYDVLLTLDSDFAHPPEKLLELMTASRNVDIVVATRHSSKASLDGWNIYRKMMTKLGYFLTRNLLGIPYDATGALRFYRLKVIPREFWNQVESKGYSFFFESLYFLCQSGYSVTQIPIILPARIYGTSKMRWSDVIQSLLRLITLYFRKFTLKRELKKKKIEPGLGGLS